ncbi:hypothetical protein GCM10011326_37210 [Salipiger profundus]|jgi:uncharacterized SAM-binding protein YcdF (DUF218 family)|uniref:DUF218 domain-containing protein n=1 Tax=Salipiger profundus TaxID=1229727 RepID=A0A1U7D661_9RHOB|nr:DUF218 domain-containing protein [Salipiger profundus]GGA21102.1 hypothetical protein GCM10011326_37210 [Salipiger profundus]SFC78051.1 DUF218 domain-containing protein [Salipiger profundus]
MRDTVGAQAPAVFFFEGAVRSVSISSPDTTEASGPDMRPVALVLGAAVWPGGRPSPTLRRRALKAAALWHEGQVRAIIGCGGVGRHPPSEAEVIRALCLEAGVPAERLLCEPQSTTTEENIRFALPLLARLCSRRVVLVSDAYHLPRAWLVARRSGLAATGAAPPLAGAKASAQIRAALREVPAFVWYWLRGRGK